MVIADEESKYLWDYYERSKLEDVDLIISAGDLDAAYLSFLVTMYSVPVLYIHGNHDDKYEVKPPEGCICIDDDVYIYEGIRIVGLGGSMRYSSGKHQFTDMQMHWRMNKLRWKVLRKGGIDILVTHAPAFEINDGRDLPHQGFKEFVRIMDRYRPKFFIHGHVHMNYGRNHRRYDKYNETHIINAYERCIFDYEAEGQELAQLR